MDQEFQTYTEICAKEDYDNFGLTSAALFILNVPSLWASTVFTDNTFNLTDYSISAFQTGGGTFTNSQTLTNGNPGAALDAFTNLPAGVGQSFSGTVYFLNNLFVYDPSSQGAIQSISLSVDQALRFTGQNPTAVAFTPVLLQGGNYYVDHIGIALTQGVYQTVAATNLLASDFVLVTNMINETDNPNAHPNFSGGAIEFGFSSGLSSSGIAQAVTKDALYDNLSYTLVSAAPEPRATFITILGFVVIALVAFTRNQKASA